MTAIRSDRRKKRTEVNILLFRGSTGYAVGTAITVNPRHGTPYNTRVYYDIIQIKELSSADAKTDRLPRVCVRVRMYVRTRGWC